MKLIVGLGNPGEKYEKNRHNVGFVVVDELGVKLKADKFEFSKKFNSEIYQTKEYILAKPQTFMNQSGKAVAALINFYKIPLTDVYIIHDDLDIDLGKYKIQHGKGPQVHNGLRSVEAELGSDQFWNVRIGVENRSVRGNSGVPGMVYSLQDFRVEEQKIVAETLVIVVEDLLTRLG